MAPPRGRGVRRGEGGVPVGFRSANSKRRDFASPRLRGEGSAFGRTSGAKRSGGEGRFRKGRPADTAAPSSATPLTLACFAGLLPSAALSPQAGRGEVAKTVDLRVV